MQRINVFRIVKTIDAIMNSVEIKSNLNFADLYAINKLRKKASEVNEVTTKRETDLRSSAAEAMNAAKSEADKAELNKTFKADFRNLLEEEVEFKVEMKPLPSDKAEKMLQLLDGDSTDIVIEYMIEKPKE